MSPDERRAALQPLLRGTAGQHLARLSDAEQLQAAMAGATVQGAYVLRHHPAVQYVRKRLAAGDIGALHQVTVTAGGVPVGVGR